MNHWVTSDLHLGHENILKYCGRIQFMTFEDKEKYLNFTQKHDQEALKNLKLSRESMDNMDRGLIKNWNSRVKEEDVVFHVGDFCFRNSPGGKPGEGGAVKAKEYEEQFNGRIIFIRGNHDKNNSTKTIIERIEIYTAKKRILLIHRLDRLSANEVKDYDLILSGHVHDKWKTKYITENNIKIPVVNIGVDVWKFMPMKIDEVIGYCHKEKLFKK